MFNRDFTKPNKEYFKKNKNILIAVGVFFLVGIIMFAFLGLNGNFEISGYNEFTVTVTEKAEDKFVEHRNQIGDIINSYNGKFDTMLVSGEGDNTQFIIRYTNDLSDSEIVKVNGLIAEKLDVEVSSVSEHVFVKPVVRNTDYVYTATTILLIIAIATVFAYARYNGASALTLMLACLLGTLGYLSIAAILRLVVGMSYFAMLVILNMLIVYLTIALFEDMRKSSWLTSRDYANAIKSAISASKFRMFVLGLGLMLIGLLLVLIAPSTIKYIALNIMFMAVMLLAVVLYVVPFVWSVFITQTKLRDYKIKTTSNENKK